MYFVPYFYRRSDNTRIKAVIASATDSDLACTASEPKWQSDWQSIFLQSANADLFALKTQDGELVALAAYEARERSAYVYILWMETAPSSNPTKTPKELRRYYGIGEVLLAFGIKYSIDHGLRGTIVFEAKSTRLAEQYRDQYHAKQVATLHSGGPPRFMLADEDAWNIFSKYLFQEDDL